MSRSLIIPDILRRSARRDPDKVAITHYVDGSEIRSISYLQLWTEVERLANAMLDRGLRPGDRIGVMAENSLHYCVLLLAAANAGLVPASINVLLGRGEMSPVLSELQPAAIAGDTSWIEHHADEIASAGFDGPVWRLPGFAEDLHLADVVAASGTSTASEPAPAVRLTADTPALILYTSGSSGRPKGALLSHGSLVMNAWNSALGFEIRSTDRVLIGLPMYHVSMWNTTLLPALVMGATVVLVNHLNARSILRDLHATQATVTLALPYMYKVLVDEARTSPLGRPPLRVALYGMAGMPTSLAAGIRGFLGARMTSGFGQTESGGNTLILAEADHDEKCGSIGRPVPNCEVQLMGEDGALLPPRTGQIGELVYRGPSVFEGYLGHPESAVPEDGWFHSGDLAWEDEDGFFWFQGRTRDVIKSGGENVFAAKVEGAISELPGVAEVAVVGRPSEQWGEEVIAFVAGRAEEMPTPEEIRNLLRGRLAPFEVPKAVVVVDALPKSPAGKIIKRDILSIHDVPGGDAPNP